MARRPSVLLAALLLSACASEKPRPPPSVAAPAATPAPPPEPEEAPPLLQLPPDVRPVHASLELTVVPSADDFSGTIAIDVELTRARRLIWLHGNGLEVTSAEVEAGGVRRPAAWRQLNEDGLARLDLETPLGPGMAVLRLAWRATWGQAEGLFRWQDRGDWYAATQLEPIDARRVFPGFDEPAFKHPWDVAVVAPEGLQVVGNGAEGASHAAGPGLRRVRFATTRPLPTYLLFVGVGPYDVVSAPIPPNEVRSWPLPHRGLAPKGRAAELAFGLEGSAAAVVAMERWTGIPFPYEKLDQVVSQGAPGAMENAGAIRWDEPWVLFAPGTTPEVMRRTIATLVAHEVSHQWFGDLVTLRWWNDVWLNESFATWAEARMLSAWHPAWHTELRLVANAEGQLEADGLASAVAIRVPLVELGAVEGQFNGSSYLKGSAVLAMFERFVGPERFRDGIRAFLAAHRDGNATAADFMARLSAAAGRELAPAFSSFLDQPGAPLVTVELACRGADAEVRLRASRWQPRGATPAPKAAWQIPLCVRGEAGGRPFERCTLLEGEAGALPLVEGCPDWLLPNAAASGYYRFALASTDLRRLLDRGLPRLTTGERIALLGSLRAAEQAGALPFAELLAAATRLAADPDAEVVRATLPVFGDASRVLDGDPALPALRTLAGRIYRPRFDRLGWTARAGEPDGEGRLRIELVDLLTLVAREPRTRAEAARRGERFLGLAGAAPDAGAVSPDLAKVAITVAVEERGLPAVEAAWAHFRATDAAGRILTGDALLAAEAPAVAARVGALWREPGLAPFDRLLLASGMRGRRWGSQALLARFERELPEVLAVLPVWAQGELPRGLSGLQEPGDAQRIRRVFEPEVAKRPVLARAMTQVLERIAINAAARAHRAEYAEDVMKAGR